MITDIEGRDINVGDECYMPYENTLIKIRIIKETPMTIQYNIFSKYKQVWLTNTDYMYKTGNPAKNLLKIC